MATIGEALVTLQEELRNALGSAAALAAPWELISRLARAGGTIECVLVGDADDEEGDVGADVLYGAIKGAKRVLAEFTAWNDKSAQYRC
jgi:hypothetical protein